MKPQTLSPNQPDWNSGQALEQFRKAATSHAVKSQESARKVLIDEGIHTKSGKLAKQYR